MKLYKFPEINRNVAYLTKDEQKELNYYLSKGKSAITYAEAKMFRQMAEALIDKGKGRNRG